MDARLVNPRSFQTNPELFSLNKYAQEYYIQILLK